MAYKIEIRPLAAIEIIEAFDWYELQREGLGIEFLMELEIFYAALRCNAIQILILITKSLCGMDHLTDSPTQLFMKLSMT